MPAVQEAEHRFPMGELPQEVMEICQRLAKLTELLRGPAELFLNDLSEKTGSHDVVRLHRVLLQMNRALGMFESQSKLWRLASLAQSSGAPVTKSGDAGGARWPDPRLVPLRRDPRQRSA